RAGATEEGLAKMMVGREVLLRVEKPPAQTGDVLLEVKDLEVDDERGLPAVRGVSLEGRAGESVGLAGARGNRPGEPSEASTGLRHASAGHVAVAGQVVDHPTARKMLDVGVGHIPEDRQRRGLVLEFSIAENIALHDYDKAPASRFGWLFPRRLVQRARALIREFDIRGGGPQTAG